LCWITLGWLAAAQRVGAGDEGREKLLPVRRFTRLIAWATALFVSILGIAQPVYANWVYRQGLIAQSAGNNERALACFSRVTQVDADHYDAWRQAGLTAVQLGRVGLGIGALRRAHAIMADYGGLNGELGAVLAMACRFTEAEPLLVRATQLYPRDATNFAKLALVRSSLRRFEAARAALEQAKRLQPAGELEKLVRYAEEEIQRAQSR
jgi:tetratricopeptide (TPR) repeat protein